MPQFDTTYLWSQIFWLAVSFGILYLFITGYFLPQMRQRLSHREDVIAKWMAETSRNTESRLDLEKRAAEQLSRARNEASGTVRDATEKVMREQQELDSTLEQKLQARLLRSHSDLSERVAKSRAGIADEVDSLADDVVVRILGKNTL